MELESGDIRVCSGKEPGRRREELASSKLQKQKASQEKEEIYGGQQRRASRNADPTSLASPMPGWAMIFLMKMRILDFVEYMSL